MRRRFLADEVRDNSAIITGQNAVHLSLVLRARVGQVYEIAVGGVVRSGKITAVEDGRVVLELGQEVTTVTGTQIELLVAIFKFDRFEWAIEKATELGVARIVPLIARRTDTHLGHAASKRVERWRRIAHEASQQSRRASPPIIADPVKLKDLVASEHSLKILLAENEAARTLRSVLEGSETAALSLAIGPEGGWNDEELQWFEAMKWVPVTLGPTILRAETAVVASLAIASSFL